MATYQSILNITYIFQSADILIVPAWYQLDLVCPHSISNG